MPRALAQIAVALAAVACLACTAAAGADDRGAGAAGAIRITDDLGREVALARPAVRIAALAPGLVESLFAVGCGGSVILRDEWSDYPSPGVDSIPKADGVQVSAQNVAGFSPDLVLLFADDGRNAAAFERIGVPTAVLHPDTFDEVSADLEKLGALCGRAADGRRAAAGMRAIRDGVTRRVGAAPRPSVYVEIDASDPTRPWTVGPGSFVDELVRLAGGRNAVAGIRAQYAQVSAEAVVRARPEVVLLAHAGFAGKDAAAAVLGRPGWSSLAAAREGRVIAGISPDVLSRPGPRLADGLAALAEALHPGRGGGAP